MPMGKFTPQVRVSNQQQDGGGSMNEEGLMAKKQKGKKPKSDYLLEAANEQRGNILMMYHRFEDKKPVMLFDIQEQRIYAYPYEDFKKELSEKSQASLTEQYEKALREKQMVVFVRDNVQRRLVSFSVPSE